MTKSTQRARHASKPESVTRQPKNKKRTGEAPKPVKGGVLKIDVTPEEFFKAWSRKDKEALIEVLIETLDAEAGDPDLEEGGDDEDSLGSLSSGGGPQTIWARGCGDDLEDSGLGNDDREEVNEDGDGNPDDEPSLGRTEAIFQTSANTDARGVDLEQGQFVSKPYCAKDDDLQHITVESSYRRFVHGITPQQKAMMEPRLDASSWVVLR